MTNNRPWLWRRLERPTTQRLATTKRWDIARARRKYTSRSRRLGCSSCRCMRWIRRCFIPIILGYPHDRRRQLLGQMVDNAVQFGGCFTINWHDRSIAPERLWDGCYRDLVQELRSGRAWFATARKLSPGFRNVARWFSKQILLSQMQYMPGFRRILAMIYLLCDCESTSRGSRPGSTPPAQKSTSTWPSMKPSTPGLIA